MAIREFSIGEWRHHPVPGDPSVEQTMTLAYHYNDTNMRLIDLVCVQSHATQAEVVIESLTTGDRITRVYAGPGTTVETIPAGLQGRYQLRLDARGRLDDVQFSVRFPYQPEGA